LFEGSSLLASFLI